MTQSLLYSLQLLKVSSCRALKEKCLYCPVPLSQQDWPSENTQRPQRTEGRGMKNLEQSKAGVTLLRTSTWNQGAGLPKRLESYIR